MTLAVPDPDLKIRGDLVFQTLRKGGVGLQTFFFWPFEPQFGLKIRGAPPLDLLFLSSSLPVRLFQLMCKVEGDNAYS